MQQTFHQLIFGWRCMLPTELMHGAFCTKGSRHISILVVLCTWFVPVSNAVLDALYCCRGLIVVGSPRTLVEDPSWRAWIAWVRDHGGFLTPNALPQLSSEQVGLSVAP